MKEKYNVVIAGVQLSIVTDESEEYIKSLTDKIDERIKAMIMSSKKCSKIEATLFCTLDYLDEKIKTDKAMDSLRQQMEGYVRDLESLKRENDELKKILG